MKQAMFRFYEELNIHLPEEMRKVWFCFPFAEGTTISDMLKIMGIPAEEVDLVLVDQQSRNLDYQLQDGERISVYPVFERFDIEPVGTAHESPLRSTTFCCDVHLGKLARFLRMLGFDTLYSSRFDPDALREASLQEKRILLSRSYALVTHPQVKRSFWVRSADPKEQLKDLFEKLDLYRQLNPLSRCLTCNSMIETIEKQAILHRLEPRTAAYYQEFFICRSCDQIFWKGSHFESMINFIRQEVLNKKMNDGTG
ncbi:Mut7-C ubiquitin/RNAse domain-containing protein [Prolixibacteraceae bacterium A06]|uniref:Mut7-C ubiquitin/RNAse domain-containing protein n=2 Tax=Gaoshiqia sediminis TaxID=2986998 RepID=A0AA41Y4W8_9BACT|nr:Mut7-C ubiquitin/RNAse domain-containing protein [Gaoshiqia sediminis]